MSRKGSIQQVSRLASSVAPLRTGGARRLRNANPRPVASGPVLTARSLYSGLRMLLGGDKRLPNAGHVARILSNVSDTLHHEGIVLCDRAGRIVYANATLCRMLGLARSRVVGKPLGHFFSEAHAWLHGSARGARKSTENLDTDIVTGDGRRVVVRTATYPVKDTKGRNQGCVIVMPDLTARKHAEEALARSESDLRLLSAQLLSAQELERQRIARELHDGICQSMSGIKHKLEHCAELVAEGKCDPVCTLKDAATNAHALIEEVRRIAMNLRPSTLDDLGILPTLGWFCREFRGQHPKIDVAVIVELQEDEIAEAAKTAIYRLVQEGFNNIVRHARARKISLVLVSADDHVHLRMSDDGMGFDPKALAKTSADAKGLGLASMRQRVQSSGGRFRVESIPGSGTTITAVWPCVSNAERYASGHGW